MCNLMVDVSKYELLKQEYTIKGIKYKNTHSFTGGRGGWYNRIFENRAGSTLWVYTFKRNGKEYVFNTRLA